jgi:hypothetical protein
MGTNNSNTSVQPSEREGLSLLLANASAAMTICVVMVQSAEAAQYAPAVAALPPCNGTSACPSEVPSEYVRTPSGWFHPSCVVPVAKDEEYDLQSDIIVKSSDGSRRPVPRCAYLPRDAHGNAFHPASREASRPPSIDGWLAGVSNDGTPVGAVSALSATWTVPSRPATDGGIIYLFPGLSASTILQPVLTYYYGWTIQSWDCCSSSGNILTDNGSPIAVSPGDSINGQVVGYNCNTATGVCSKWTVVTFDQTIGKGTGGFVANNTEVYGTSPDQVHGGVLEVYGIGTCSQLPASLGASFREVYAMPISGPFPNGMGWIAWTSPIQSPNCYQTSNYVIDTYSSTINLGWSEAPTCLPNCSLGMACSVSGINNGCSTNFCLNGICVPSCSPNCGLGMACTVNNDCSSNLCWNGFCAPACSPLCSPGLACGANSDCSSQLCANGACIPPSCSPNCGLGMACGAYDDCFSNFCLNGACRQSSCSPNCGLGAACSVNNDCVSNLCLNGV